MRVSSRHSKTDGMCHCHGVTEFDVVVSKSPATDAENCKGILLTVMPIDSVSRKCELLSDQRLLCLNETKVYLKKESS